MTKDESAILVKSMDGMLDALKEVKTLRKRNEQLEERMREVLAAKSRVDKTEAAFRKRIAQLEEKLDKGVKNA